MKRGESGQAPPHSPASTTVGLRYCSAMEFDMAIERM